MAKCLICMPDWLKGVTKKVWTKVFHWCCVKPDEVLDELDAVGIQHGNDEAGHQTPVRLPNVLKTQSKKVEDERQSVQQENGRPRQVIEDAINQTSTPDELHEATPKQTARHSTFKNEGGKTTDCRQGTGIEALTNDIQVDGAPVPESTPRIFSNDIAGRIFLEKPDDYSETELVNSCKSINSRMSSLTAYLMQEENRTRGLKQDDKYSRDVFRRFLGHHLYEELAKSSPDNSLARDAAIQDSLDAWSAACMHLAMQPMLFGLRLWSEEDIEEIKRHISRYDSELAQDWDGIRLDNMPQYIQTIEDISILTQKRQQSVQVCALEEVYSRQLVNENELQIPLHWRALLHKHELGLPSYEKAIVQTEEIYRKGLLQIFDIAGVDPPTLSNTLKEKISKIVRETATLAQHTKTFVFSQNVETYIVKPGETFDKSSTKSADKGDAGTVKCTIQLGLKATDGQRRQKILLMPEVLLA